MPIPAPESPEHTPAATTHGRTAEQEGLRTTLSAGPSGPFVTSRPPEHTRICWAAALGAAQRTIGGFLDQDDPATRVRIIDTARALLTGESPSCICRTVKGRPARGKTGHR